MSEPTLQSYALSLGRPAERSITDYGEQMGAQRKITFHNCKLSNRFDDFEIDGQKVKETFVSADIYERSSSYRPRGVEPGSAGLIDPRTSAERSWVDVRLWVSPVVFQQFWDLVDTPRTEQFVVFIEGHANPAGRILAEFVVLDDRLMARLAELRPSTHPVVREIQRHRPILTLVGIAVGLILAIEVIRLLGQ